MDTRVSMFERPTRAWRHAPRWNRHPTAAWTTVARTSDRVWKPRCMPQPPSQSPAKSAAVAGSPSQSDAAQGFGRAVATGLTAGPGEFPAVVPPGGSMAGCAR